MGLQGHDHVSPGDLMRRLRELERKVQGLETARRLEAASIGSGGLTVKDGGQIQILDEDGTVAATLAPAGVSINAPTDSDGLQAGEISAGDDDSAGAGFRQLRIPN